MKSEMNQEAVYYFISYYLQVNMAMDMGMGDVEEEADDVYNGILGEIGLEYEVNAPVLLITYSNYLLQAVSKAKI